MSWIRERARVAALAAGDLALVDPRDAQLAAYVEQTLAAAPPLTAEQRDRLALLLRTTPTAGGAAA